AFLAYECESDESHYVQDRIFARFNETITGFRKDNQLNLKQSLVLLGGMSIMCANIAIAIYLATHTFAEIRKAKTFSFDFKRLQIKILRALFAQTVVPVVFVYIPFGCAILFPFFNIDDTLQIANNSTFLTSFFPV
ncbi:hypothetical protein PMAYCL1PPCAC_15648, partial [Pristionchus mayeri]